MTWIVSGRGQSPETMFLHGRAYIPKCFAVQIVDWRMASRFLYPYLVLAKEHNTNMSATIASYAFLLEGICFIIPIGVIIGRNMEQHARWFVDWPDYLVSGLYFAFAIGFFLGWKLL